MKLGGTAEVKLLLSYRKIGQDFLRDKQRRIDPIQAPLPRERGQKEPEPDLYGEQRERAQEMREPLLIAAEALPKTQPIYK